MADLKEAYDQAVQKYGSGFRNPYGWAAGASGKKSPTFADIEHSVKLDHFRSYYKLASHGVLRSRSMDRVGTYVLYACGVKS